MQKKRVAIVVSDLSILSGVPMVAKFLYEVISKSEKYTPQLISISTSARDLNSIRILEPKSWVGGIKISERQFQGIDYRHIGSNLTEIEFFHYLPRRILDEVLSEFDLIQIVAGLPMWFHVAKNFPGKVVLKIATLTDVERESTLNSSSRLRKTWMRLMNKINRKLEKRAFAEADAIFTENNWLWERLEKLYPEKVVMAPPGIDVEFFRAKKYCQDGYLLCVGRFADPRKNVRLLFHAYRQILDKNPSAPPLVLAGQTAPTPGDMAEARKLKITQKLKIYTGVTSDELLDLYQNASIFVLSSNEEGFGLVIAEAMSCNLPVVATKCGGPEILVDEGKTGYLTRTGDANLLAEKINELLHEPERRRKFGEAGRERVVENFSLEAAGRIYLKTYDKLLNL